MTHNNSPILSKAKNCVDKNKQSDFYKRHSKKENNIWNYVCPYKKK